MQVSNWFINARVRLWKPMVEEMYLEEIKEQEQNGGGSAPPAAAPAEEKSNDDSSSKSIAPPPETKSPNSKQENSPNQNVHPSISISTSAGGNPRNPSGFSLIGPSSELDGITQGSPKKQRGPEILHSSTNVPFINIKPRDDEEHNPQTRDGYSFLGQTHFNIGGFGQYPIGEIGRFDADQFAPRFSGNGVSLTLGLPHCENLSLNAAAAAHQSFLPNQSIHLGGRRTEIGKPNDFAAINATSTPHSSTAFETINIQNGKRFAAQLLPDFVA